MADNNENLPEIIDENESNVVELDDEVEQVDPVELEDDITPVKTEVEEDILTAELEANRAKQEADRAAANADQAIADINKAVDTKKNELNAIKTSADKSAAQAMNIASQAQTRAEDANDAVARQNKKIKDLENALDEFVANGYVEDYTGIFVNRGSEVLFTMKDIGGGGGGGGGGGEVITAVMTLDNITGWTQHSFVPDTDVNLSVRWSSVDQDMPTGDGTMQIVVNNIVRSTRNVAQGDVTVNVREFMGAGDNSVQIRVTDSYGQLRRKNFTVTIVSMSISSTFDDSVEQTGPITISYTPVGEVAKTVKFELDGEVIGTIETSASNRQLTYVIPMQPHGVHKLRIWFEAELNGAIINQNGEDFALYYEITCLEAGNTDTIIACGYNGDAISQYTTANLVYRVYDPTKQVADVDIQLDGETVSELKNVDRTNHTFSWRFDEDGEHTVTFLSNGVSKSITLTVTPMDIDVHAETQNLALYLTSNGRSNSEANPGTWVYEDTESEFTGFNFVSDGWVQDADGVTVLRVKDDARLLVPYQIFGKDFRQTGKTIEVEFATHDVRNYSDPLISCMSGGRGLEITAQDCRIASEQATLSAQFKEDEHVRVSFVVDQSRGKKLIRCYINGVMSRVVKYQDDDNFKQVTPVGISIGNDEATIDLYCIRVYDMDLSAKQIVDNWIADTQNGALMLERYSHNNILDAYGNITISKLPADLPYFVVEAPELPQFKGDKKSCNGLFVNPLNTDKNFTFEGAQIDVQGTSSQYYYRKNYKLKFKGGIIDSKGAAQKKYQINDDAIPVSTFCFKADVASSEGANNVELARLYDEACPYKTPAQKADSRVRQGVDGFPMVMFWSNPDTGITSFLGKYNFNNDKSTEDVFGFVEGDESWETKNHDGERIIYKSDDFTDGVWQNDFEARFPDTDPPYEDITQLREFVHWVMTTDTTTATDEALPEPVSYGGTEYTTDSAEYRLAKFKYELEKYCEVDSALFFYLFTEVFLLVDNRAKNQFISFMGEEVTQ